MQCGWWRVTDQRLLKDLTKALHQRGIREKSLQKNILKFNDYTHHAFEKQEYQCKCLLAHILSVGVRTLPKRNKKELSQSDLRGTFLFYHFIICCTNSMFIQTFIYSTNGYRNGHLCLNYPKCFK